MSTSCTRGAIPFKDGDSLFLPHESHNDLSISGFVTIGTLFDVGVWYFVKDVKIFDEEIELQDIAEEPGETL